MPVFRVPRIVESVYADTTALKADTAAIIADTTDLLVDTDTIIDETVEIETHLHSYERWLGAIAVPTATRFADVTETAFQVDSGNLIWGDWVQIMGSDDTPLDSGKTYFDLHRLLIIGAEQTATYRLQVGFGASGAAALSSGDYIELLIKFPVGASRPTPVDIQGERRAAGTEAWARCRCASNTGTLDFLLGIHEYNE